MRYKAHFLFSMLVIHLRLIVELEILRHKA